MRIHILIGALALGGIAACGTEAPAPAKPTWVDDVQPIMQGNCFHCHGEGPRPKGANRWDVYSLSDPFYAQNGFVEDIQSFVGASNSSHFNLIPVYISPQIADTGRMPPPPATRLSVRDQTVLTNWMKTGFTKGSHSPNHKPTIAWLQKPKTFVVSDEDGDQVLGKLTCGTDELSIPRTGGHKLGNLTPPCTAALYDGFDETSVDLK